MQDRSPPARQNPLATHGRTIHWVKSVVLCNRRLPVNFRYALLATEIARRCNMSRRANRRHFALQHIGEIQQRPICPMLSPAEPNLNLIVSSAFFFQLGQQERFHIRRHRVTSDNLWPKSDWRRGD
jgi:hypothetical protein